MKAFFLLQTLGTMAVVLVMIIVWGVPLAPTLLFYDWTTELVSSETKWLQALYTGLSLSSSVIFYCFTLLLFSSMLQFILHVRIHEKSVYPLASLTTIRWAFCGQIIRATQPILQHFVPSFVSNLYYRICGAKIGKRTQINTHRLNDPCLIRIDDECVVGGGATFNGHLVEKGEIVFAPIHMKAGSLVGAGATIQPGVTIGENAVIASHGLIPKYRTIPENEVWGGLPALKIQSSSERRQI
jgi:acetyltransferase-like isoleucine patch superfamily enzyme